MIPLRWAIPAILCALVVSPVAARAAELEVGQKAPEFEVPDQTGKVHKLTDYKGKRVILAFYPAASTAG